MRDCTRTKRVITDTGCVPRGATPSPLPPEPPPLSFTSSLLSRRWQRLPRRPSTRVPTRPCRSGATPMVGVPLRAEVPLGVSHSHVAAARPEDLSGSSGDDEDYGSDIGGVLCAGGAARQAAREAVALRRPHPRERHRAQPAAAAPQRAPYCQRSPLLLAARAVGAAAQHVARHAAHAGDTHTRTKPLDRVSADGGRGRVGRTRPAVQRVTAEGAARSAAPRHRVRSARAAAAAGPAACLPRHRHLLHSVRDQGRKVGA
jgi:hypothetical protein